VIPSTPLEVPCLSDCFEPGFQLGFYGAGAIFSEDADEHAPDQYEDSLGGGVSFTYYATSNLGFQVDGTWLSTAGTLHSFSGSLIYRMPIKGTSIAPYVFGGGGVMVDGVTQATVHAGAGLEYCLGGGFSLFADARYTWTECEDNFTSARAGLNISL
jgi:hypothetical protein